MHTHLNIPTGQLLSLLIPLIILELLLVIFALVDLIRRESARVRGNKLMWALIILLTGTIGPICYFVIGRKEA